MLLVSGHTHRVIWLSHQQNPEKRKGQILLIEQAKKDPAEGVAGLNFDS